MDGEYFLSKGFCLIFIELNAQLFDQKNLSQYLKVAGAHFNVWLYIEFTVNCNDIVIKIIIIITIKILLHHLLSDLRTFFEGRTSIYSGGAGVGALVSGQLMVGLYTIMILQPWLVDPKPAYFSSLLV